jgi:hypothetical protein
VPPSVPTHTASIVQRTIDSSPAIAAIFAATKGSVARSGSSLSCVQLKISLPAISSSPFHAHQEASVARSLDRTNEVAHHPSERRQVLLRSRIPRAHHEDVADRDLLHAPAEFAAALLAMRILKQRHAFAPVIPHECGASRSHPLAWAVRLSRRRA